MFADEAGFSVHPKIGRVWALKGSSPVVPTTSHHAKRLNLFGWVAPIQGWHGFIRWPKGNTDGFLVLLNYLTRRLAGWRIFLYVDGARWHKGVRVKQFLKEHANLILEYLPPYHPELNPQERIWHMIRYEVTTNRYYISIDAIHQSIRQQRHRWKPKKIRSLCRVI